MVASAVVDCHMYYKDLGHSVVARMNPLLLLLAVKVPYLHQKNIVADVAAPLAWKRMDVGKHRRQRHHQADLFAQANLEHCWTQNHRQSYKEVTNFHLFVEQNLKVVLKLMANLEAVVLLKVTMLGHYLLLWPAPSHDL